MISSCSSVERMNVNPLPFLKLRGVVDYLGCPDHRTTTQNKAKGHTTDNSRDGDGHKATSLDGGVAADCESEESTDHESHDATLDHIISGSFHFSFESIPLLGKLAGTIKRYKVFGILFFFEGSLVGIMS